MKDATEILQELLDKESIQQIRNQFAEALDNKDWPLFESLFTDEVDTDWSAWGVPQQKMTKADITTMFSQGAFRRPELVTEHLYTNFRIKITGDKATCVSNFLGQHHIPGFKDGDEFYLRGEYSDEFIRTNTGWRISQLKLRIFYSSGNPQLLA